ncbi:RNA recognition motif domain - like 10 [Theobroma cacao]|nr:RNA recognition motif domain - like 10 [Theobroma cacao]
MEKCDIFQLLSTPETQPNYKVPRHTQFQHKYLVSGLRTVYINPPEGFTLGKKAAKKYKAESHSLTAINSRVVTMAFLSKIGNILRQTTNTQINAQLSASRPGLFQVFRCMSTSPSSKLFVGGISYSTDDQSLKEAFGKYGEVIEARVIVDRETGRSRGFGFVTYTSTEDASSALQALDGQVLHGRQVRVNYAAERPPRNFGGGGYNSGYGAPGGGFNSGYGGGSYGGGGYGGGGYGGGNYGGGNYGGGGGYDGNAGSSSGNYGGNVGYGSNSGGTGNYGGQGSGDNYGTGGVGYGNSFGQSGANSYDSGSFNVAGGGGGSDSFATGGSGGCEGDNMGSGGGDQLDSAEDGHTEEAARGFDQNDPLNENFRDDEDDGGDFAKRA